MAPRPHILVSACLLGQKVRYDGAAKSMLDQQLEALKALAELHPFCPEVAGGLPTPRPPAEIQPGHHGTDILSGHGKVLELGGGDVTGAFLTGAQKALGMVRRYGCDIALMTERSPSCGVLQLYSGEHDGQLRSGVGVTSAALRQAGVTIYGSDQIDRLLRDLRVTQRSG